MGQFFSWVKSNEKKILITLDDLAKKAVEISEALVVMLTDLKNADCHKEIHALETQADSLVRDIFSELNRTFITPLDREDMQSCLLYTSPSPRDRQKSRMPSSA